MTTVVMYRRGNRYAGFSARGHAGFAQNGSDIVCSAISALLQGTVIGLDVAGITAKVSGRLRVMLGVRQTREKRERSELLMETLLRSLRSIEAQYPDNLSVIITNLKGGYYV